MVYNFANTRFNEYVYSDDFIEINVNIFNCPFPCMETRNSLVVKYQLMINKLNNNPYGIMTYRQNIADINFINNFYSSLDKLFSKTTCDPRIKIVVNSWVSFKNLEGYTNFKMFPNLLKLANKYNIIATEWEFIDNLKFTKIVSNYGEDDKNFISCYINYVNKELPNSEHNIGTNLFVIDFNSKYCLKSIKK